MTSEAMLQYLLDRDVLRIAPTGCPVSHADRTQLLARAPTPVLGAAALVAAWP